MEIQVQLDYWWTMLCVTISIYGISPSLQGGSAGKGTALDDNSDADLVTFLSCFSSYSDQKEKRASIIKTIETELKRSHKSIAYKVEFSPPNVDDSLRRNLKIIITSTKKKEPVEVDILPAYNVLGNSQQSLPWWPYAERILHIHKSQIINNFLCHHQYFDQ